MTITMSPARGDLNPKKTTDHKTFTINWTVKTVSAILTGRFLTLLRQTRNAAIPMRRNKVSHTGANTQLGGVNDGFLRVAYQVEIEGAVKTDPITPAT